MRSQFLFSAVVMLVGCAEGAQTHACREYVQCLEVRDAELGITTNTDRFESGGACWGSPAGAELCDTACVRGLEFLSSLENAPAECAP